MDAQIEISVKTRKKLDKFYTKKAIAKMVWNIYTLVLKQFDYEVIVEPSSGGGAMLKEIKGYNKVGLDICPENKNVIRTNFLTGNWISENLSEKKIAIFGNPPFGRRAKLAIDFVNKSFENANMVGMILPNQFKKYSTHKRINTKAKLIFEMDLPENSFTLGTKNYNANCVFQIWTTRFDLKFSDLRILNKPPILHRDFLSYQYNITPQSKKYFNYDWDIAILRQGYGNFNEIHTKEEVLSRKKQWLFIKAKNPQVLETIKQIDFNLLANKNTSVKGFGKADLVEAYSNLKEELTNRRL